MRQLKREVKIGNMTIGGKNPIAVQTMLNVPVEDIEGNVAQAKRCEAAGCQILRVTCPAACTAVQHLHRGAGGRFHLPGWPF